jgi:hypothetical protein
MSRTDSEQAFSPAAVQALIRSCRSQLPEVELPPGFFARHLERTFDLYHGKVGAAASRESYLGALYCLEWFIACACLEGSEVAWEQLFARRAGQTGRVLVDALRARARQLYPRDTARQHGAVAEFWSHLLVADAPDCLPALACYDGQRPLVPWLIRVFHNWNLLQLRRRAEFQPMPQDEAALPAAARGSDRWHEAFCAAARECVCALTDQELLILALRLRHGLSQRAVASLLGVHEGTVSRRTSHLRDHCLGGIHRRLVAAGWTGDDLSEFIRSEMAAVLQDDPRFRGIGDLCEAAG